jgi:transposase
VALNYVAKGNTQQQAADIYSVSISSMKRWKKAKLGIRHIGKSKPSMYPLQNR